MTTLIETMKQALEALKEAHPKPYNESVISHVEAITALRTAIEAADKQEPVALEAVYETIIQWDEGGGKRSRRELAKRIVALYTTPPAAQPAQQEPVAWAVFEGWNAHDLYLPQEYDEALKMAGYKGDHAAVKPLYTTPPAAQRQPLTDEQVRDLWSWSATAEAERTATTQQHAFARAIEAAHGIKGEA